MTTRNKGTFFHLSKDGQFRICQAKPGQCKMSPGFLHFKDVHSKEAILAQDRYNELTASGLYKHTYLSSMLNNNPTRSIPEYAFIVDSDHLNRFHSIDLYVIHEESQRELDDLKQHLKAHLENKSTLEQSLKEATESFMHISTETYKQAFIEKFYQENDFDTEELEVNTMCFKGEVKVEYTDGTKEILPCAECKYKTDGTQDTFSIKGQSKPVRWLEPTDPMQAFRNTHFKRLVETQGHYYGYSTDNKDNLMLARKAYLSLKGNTFKKVEDIQSELSKFEYTLYPLEYRIMEQEQIARCVSEELAKRKF